MNFERPELRSESAESWSKKKEEEIEPNEINIKRIIIVCGNALALAQRFIFYMFCKWIKCLLSQANIHHINSTFSFLSLLQENRILLFPLSPSPSASTSSSLVFCVPFIFLYRFVTWFSLRFRYVMQLYIFGLLEHNNTISWPWLFPFSFPIIFFSFFHSSPSISRFLFLSNRLHQFFFFFMVVFNLIELT